MIRGKILFLSLCAIGVLAAILTIIELWSYVLDWDIYLKLMGTILVLGTQLSFLVAVDYDLPASKRKWLLLGLVGLSALGTALLTLQIWVQALDWDIFLKLLGTMGVGVLLLGFLVAVAEDFGSNKRLKDNNYID